jgi:penicillin-binding protein 1A
VAGLVLLAIVASACNLPTLDEEQARARALPQTSFLYAGDGSLITSFHSEQDRILVKVDQVPRIVREAVISIEDHRFYQHKGVDLKALLRAAYVDAKTGRIAEGGSTITEQYIKNRFLGPDQTLKRKLREAVLAWQLEHRLGKNQILERYLNTVYFGHGAYGIGAAAETYFSETVEDLSLIQGALLAGLIQAPSAYEPIDHPALARTRRDLVLQRMNDYGKISTLRYSRAIRRPLRLHPAPAVERYDAPYFVQFVKDWFVSNPAFGPTRAAREDLLFSGGLHITTTLDPKLQADAEESVRQILLYRSDPYGAMTVIDPRSGFVKAMVGGRDFFSTTDPVAQVNLATGGITGRQAGSSFKPFALVAALEAGIAPQKTYDAPPSIAIPLPQECQAPGEPYWFVSNYDGTGAGQLTVEEATIDSVNVVYAQIVRDLGAGDPCAGAQKVVAVARQLGVAPPSLLRMGVSHPLEAVPASVLGAEQVNTVEMASAYGTLANVGYRVAPTPILQVTDPRGRVLYDAHPVRRPVLNPPIAWVTDQILEKVVQYGTGAQANIGRPAIGKTGTSQRYRDAWFVGAVPQLVAAVWVGFPQREVPMVAPRTRLEHVLGGTWPAQIWNLFMTRATKHMKVQDFPQPTSQYVTVEIDTSRNCLPNQFTPPLLIQPVTYLEGTQPPTQCTEPTTYQPLPVPSVVGMSQEDATTTLQENGFGVRPIAEYSDQAPGTVVGQDPQAGQQALQASTITIFVSQGPQPTPPPCPNDPAGSPLPTPPGCIPVPPSPSPSPSGSPSPSSSPSPSPSSSPSPSGSTSPTPKVVTVPDVVGMAQRDAVDKLQAAGFGVAVIQKPQCTGDGCSPPHAVVWREDPAGGTKAEQGSTVTIWANP